ncbi:hypothetical protein B0H12DRAFT_1246996 [Mycena haematopus]|nr:hypothetical protein B0H12DRAFT_1246996 [Mycena haematopus]
MEISSRAPTSIAVDQLTRHVLDVTYEFRVNDRVRVVSSGMFYQGVLGRVLEILDDGRINIGVPDDCVMIGPTDPSPRWPGVKTFSVAMGHAMREFHLGDWVESTMGQHTGRVGVIVGMQVSLRVLRVWIMSDSCTISIESGAVDFYQQSTDLLPLLAGDHHEPSPQLKVGDVDEWLCLQDVSNPSSEIYIHSKEVESASTWRYGAGRRLEQIEVQVQKGQNKGLRGIVVGDYDSQARVERMARDKNKWDSDGILLTIGPNGTNRRVENIPIERRP